MARVMVMGNGAMLVAGSLILGVGSAVRVAIEAEEQAFADAMRARLEDGGELIVCIGMDLSGEPDRVPDLAMPRFREKMTAMTPVVDRSRPWIAMNERHVRRAGRRSSAVPRVICPA